MKLHFFSYRYSQEILQHENNRVAWFEIENILRSAPLFVYPNKSPKNKRLSVVQQLMNTYFDRRFAVDFDWLYHPLATRISDSGLAADFRKTFPNITIQAEVQFGNMARWYSDIFKLQTAYSQSLVDCGLCVVPVSSLAKKIDSNIAEFERVCREIPAANLSITLPILIVGLEVDESTSESGRGRGSGRGHGSKKSSANASAQQTQSQWQVQNQARVQKERASAIASDASAVVSQ